MVQKTCDEERYAEMKQDLFDEKLVDEVASLDHSKLGSVGDFAVINMQDKHLDAVEANPDEYANDRRKVSVCYPLQPSYFFLKLR